MRLSLYRRAHVWQHVARASRFPMINVPNTGFGTIQDYAGATVMLIRSVEIKKWRYGTIPDRQKAAV
eukprot:722856-Pyramimonas_sp.AAC.1